MQANSDRIVTEREKPGKNICPKGSEKSGNLIVGMASINAVGHLHNDKDMSNLATVKTANSRAAITLC